MKLKRDQENGRMVNKIYIKQEEIINLIASISSQCFNLERDDFAKSRANILDFTGKGIRGEEIFRFILHKNCYKGTL